MTKAVHARRRGDDFQAYCFWRRACHMLMPNSDITSVGFELSSPYNVFDDVAVLYSGGRPWRGGLVFGDYAQIKHSVNYSKAITFDSLLDPALINATSVSILQRLYSAVRTMEANGDNHRFILLAPWSIHHGDVLAELIRREDGGIDLDRLFDGTGSRGKMGIRREQMVDHLGLSDQDQLRPILERFQIAVHDNNLEHLRDEVWRDLGAVGLRQMDLSSRGDEYCQLPWRFHQDGMEWHTADSLRALAQQEGIWIGQPDSSRGTRLRLGVRSFMRWAEDMDVKTDHMLCLVEHFVGRRIRDPKLWHDDILPSVLGFVRNHVSRGSRILLDIQSLCSVAFLLGHLIEPKLAVDVAILQGGSEWIVRPSLVNTVKPAWSVKQWELKRDGTDLVVGFGVTRDVTPAVQAYVDACLPSACRIVVASPILGPSVHAVEHGTQALAMAEQIVTLLRTVRAQQGIRGTTHIFLSAPNAFSFFLGQVGRPLGAVQL